MRRRRFLATAGLLSTAPLAPRSWAAAPEKFTVLLDWFVNPDHAPLFVAKYIGAYEKAGLAVELVPPADPDVPPRLLAAGHADAALSYQTQLYLLVDQGLPLKRAGTLIDQPLDTLTALAGRGIRTLADFKGRKIGYSVAGVQEALIGTMLRSVGLELSDVTLVNVNFALVTALMSHEVDGVIGTYRNFEDNELKEKGLTPVIFLPEDHGVPASDELIILANSATLDDPRRSEVLARFLGAAKEGGAYLAKNPEAMWAEFVKENPSLNDELNKTAWFQTIRYFAPDPFMLDARRYTVYRDFMLRQKLIKRALPLSSYAVQIGV